LYNLVKFYKKLNFKKRIMAIEEKEIMTFKQVAEYLQMSTSSIYKMAQTGKIPAYKVGRQWRFKKEEIDAWVKKNCKGKR